MDKSVPEIPPVNFIALNKINTIAATSHDVAFENIKNNIKRNYKRLHEMAMFKKPKGDFKIALVGGGPSLNSTIEDIKIFEGVIVACGSVYDYLIENGVTPHYCVLCDPDPITALYIKKADSMTIFLVATQCDNSVFDVLKNKAVYMWHCYNEEFDKFKEIEPEFQAIGGGCTVGLRSLSIAIMLGFSDIHFFGFDSCLGQKKEHHAYNFNTDTEELGQLYSIKLYQNSDITYLCAGYHLAQIQHFQEFYAHYNEFFKPTFHGEGLLKDFMKKIETEIEKSNSLT